MIKHIANTFSTTQHHRLFLFAGQGTQEVGMLNSIPPPLRTDTLQKASSWLGLDLEEIVTEDQGKVINQTEITQPLLMLSHWLHFKAKGYDQTLSRDDWMIGHSLGQFSALVNAGSLSLEEGLKLVHLRGALMKKHTTSPHGMLIVKYKPEKEEAVLDQIKKSQLEIACINTKTSIVVAGLKESIERLAKVMRTHQAAALTLPVSTAFHCKMLDPMKTEFRQALNKIDFKTPQCKIIRNYDCAVYESGQDIREGLVLQLTSAVRFGESVEKVPLSTQVIEVGHRAWISKFAEEVRHSSFLSSLI